MSQIKSLRDSAALRRHTRWASDSAQIGATSGIALIMSVGNLGGFAGPYSLGAINKRTGSVQAGFVFVGVAMLLAALPLLGLPETRNKQAVLLGGIDQARTRRRP